MFVAALLVRAAVSLVRASHGLTFTSPGLEGIDDFDSLYVSQLAEIARGLIPYRDFAVSYPPLFLYTLFPFYYFGGADWAALPIVVCDAATAVAIYYAAEAISGQKLAVWAGIGYAVSPFAVYYEGYVWFSSQPMTFFAVLGLCFLVRKRPVLSLSSLGVAVLFKQEVVFMLPIFLVAVAFQERRRLAKAFGAFSSVVVGVSAPFLAIAPIDYLTLISYGLLGRWPGTISPGAVGSSSACQTLQELSTETVLSCVSGTSSVVETVNNYLSPTAVFLNYLSYDLNVVASIVAVPLFLLLGPVLFSLRRHKAEVPILCAYLGIGFCIAFSIIFHPVYRYYYLPVYAALLVGSTSRGVLGVAFGAMVFSMITASGAFQEIVPMLALLVIAPLLDRQARDSRTQQVATAPPP